MQVAFDRFSETSRRALFYARVAVSEHGGVAIRDAHLVLGLLRAAPSELWECFSPSVPVQALSECLIGRVAGPTIVPESQEVPFSPLTRHALVSAMQVAGTFGHGEIAPEHLLIAVLRIQPGEAVGCFRALGVDIEQTVAAVSQRLRDRPL